MSKKEQTKTNTDKKNNIQKSIFFPDVFRGKKLKKEYWLGKSNEQLEKYLETEDTKYLFEAIKKHTYILEKPHYDYDYYDIGNGKNEENVDGASIVWVSIYYWKWLAADFDPYQEKEYIKEARRLLINVGRALIPESSWAEEILGNDGFKHIKPIDQKSTNAALKYKNPSDFLKLWNTIENVFKNSIKKRYPSITRTLLEEMRIEGNESIIKALATKSNYQDVPKINDIINIVNETFQIELSPEIIKTFKISSVGEITASFIAYLHESKCDICVKDSRKSKSKYVGFSTIIKLKKEAENETM